MRSYYLMMCLITMCSCAYQLNPSSVLQDARRATDEGRYEEALSKYVWFHDHALSIDRSYYGVRLSFALADWVRLGHKYPPAIDKLYSIRSNKTAQILSGKSNSELFHDVESINDHLKDYKATVDLFKTLDSTDSLFAISVYELAEESLINEGAYSLANKYVSDPQSRLSKAQISYQEGLNYANTGRHRDSSKQAFESIYADEIVRLLVILRENGRDQEARTIYELAINTLDDSRIRKAYSAEEAEPAPPAGRGGVPRR